MTAPGTVTVDRLVLDAIVQELIALIDTADRVAAIEADKAAQDAEG